MNKNVEPTTRGDFEFFDCKPPSTDMLTEVVHGLTANNKRLPPKYFYDEMGSALFDAITRLPEYYLTRTELGLFDAYGGEMGEEAGNVASVVEYGSGSSIKIRKLLESVDPQAYAPVDISSDHLRLSARQLHDDYPWLHVYPICADYTEVFALPEPIRQHSKLGFFPGSSIGNFEPEDVVRFLVNVRETLGQGSEFIVGVDLEKPRDVLDAAYNDASGVTARFNLNLLNHLNDVLEADFDVSGFLHEARYDERGGRVQMYLRSVVAQTVNIAGHRFEFAKGEEIHTENSYKYSRDHFIELARRAGFRDKMVWTDARDWFAVVLLEDAR